MPDLIIKLCGNKTLDGINRIKPLVPEYVGFIFYPPSKRFFQGDIAQLQQLKQTKVGVFVDSPEEEVKRISSLAKLDYIQLHGNESVAYCRSLSQTHKIIKAFGIHQDTDFSELQGYMDSVHYFLFDTDTPLKGGSGKTYDRSILKRYALGKPFFVSGGIDIEEALYLLSHPFPAMVGIDINSRFELSPGEKDNSLIQHLLSAYYGHIS